jgi:PhnB protein
MEIPGHYKYAVIPHIMVDGAAAAITFYAEAFGASELFRLDGDDGKIIHAEISVQGSTLMLGDAEASFASPGPGGACVALHVYVPDVDALTARAVAAGGTSLACDRHDLRSPAVDAARPVRPRLDLPDSHRHVKRGLCRDQPGGIAHETRILLIRCS